MEHVDIQQAGEIISQAKQLARKYKDLTGKPLGITGEVAEYEAARILGLELCHARQEGYDAIAQSDGKMRRVQIKARCVRDLKSGQRLGKIRLDCEWDIVLLVILDVNFEPQLMYEAYRSDVEMAIRKPGSKSRNERGQLSIGQFKPIAKKVWEKSNLPGISSE